MASCLGGRVAHGQPGRIIEGITTQPRFASSGLALAMLRPHPRSAVIAAVRRGAPLVVTAVQARTLPPGATTVIVANPRHAYRGFARSYRLQLGVPVIAITGTAGKTTTKEMVRSILAVSRKVVATAANYNANPAFTILRAGVDTDIVILEMGMDRRGQIAAQCRLAVPDVGVITNVGRAHLNHCGGFMGVVRAKNELVHGVKRGGTVVLNADDAGSKLLDTAAFHGRIVRFGRAAGADYRLLEVRAEARGTSFLVAAEDRQFALTIPVAGEHMVYDALAAIAAARAAGASWDEVRRGLADFEATSGRLDHRRAGNGATVIDDSYNANPLSVVAALQTLRDTAAGRRTIMVLGNMEEQGRGWRESHRQIGSAVAKAGIDYLATVGGLAAEIAAGAVAAGMPRSRVHHGVTHTAAIAFVRRAMTPDSVVLVKGSHSTGMGRIVRTLAPRRG